MHNKKTPFVYVYRIVTLQVSYHKAWNHMHYGVSASAELCTLCGFHKSEMVCTPFFCLFLQVQNCKGYVLLSVRLCALCDFNEHKIQSMKLCILHYLKLFVLLLIYT